jgi:hypothetical protein
MLRSALGKVVWVGRATVFLVGLAVILAMVMGLASAAFSATGGNFILGQSNSADQSTTLVGQIVDTTKSALVLKNPNGGSALQLQVNSGQAPLKVNSTAGKATNLNADKLDGKDSSEFVRSLWAKVKDDGTLLAGKGATSVQVGGGGYFVRFDRDITNCAYIATVGQQNTAYFDPGEVQATHTTGAGSPTRDVFVAMSDNDTGAISRGFSLVVVC